MIIVLLVCTKVGAVSISFSKESIRLSSGPIAIDSVEQTFSIKKGNFKAGSISEFELSELIYPDYYIWKDKAERKKTANIKGFGYFDDSYALFLTPDKRFSIGSYVSFKGISLSFLRYQSGERGDELYSYSKNRGGFAGENIILRYTNKYLLFRVMVSLTHFNEISRFYSLGVSYNNIALTASFGDITYYYKEANPKTLVITSDISSRDLNISLTYSKGSTPYIGGTYRSFELSSNVRYRYKKLILRSEYKLSFTEKGKYIKDYEYELLLYYFGLRFDNSGSFTYIFKKDWFRFESNLKTFSVAFNLDRDSFSIYLSLSSEFKVKTSVTLNFGP